MNDNARPLRDEVDATDKDPGGTPGPFDTEFELYPPGTVIGPAYNQPARGSGIPGSLTIYPPSNAAETWIRYRTLPAPVACGTYIMRSGALYGDQNSWRLQMGYDDGSGTLDSNPDGILGTNDELTLGITQTSYQHDINSPPDPEVNQCLTLYEYVDPGLAATSFHNFDLDAGLRVTYYAPGAPFDPTGKTGGIAGNPSGQTVWNGGTATNRGTGDVVTNPAAGWWRIVTCATYHNQYIQEGQTGAAAYYEQPPTPAMSITKDDGRTITGPNAVQTYTMAFTNTSNNTATPGAATNVVLHDQLPTNAIYQSCAINPPYTGSCTASGGVVTYNLDGWVSAGASGSVQVTVKVAPTASGTVVNSVTLDYNDGLGNPFPPAIATDIDVIQLADLRLAKTVDTTAPTLGSNVSFTITINNDGPDTATNVQVGDLMPAGLLFVSAVPSQGSYNGATNIWVVGSLPNGGSARVVIVATVTTAGSFTNTAQVTASDQGDPDSTPNNGDPSEDDQASVGLNSPTAISLARFTATPRGATVELAWTTSAEVNTWGFALLRSADGTRANAVRVSPELIVARGRGTAGASYTWSDTTARAGQPYRYWLQEVELDGSMHEYGPAGAQPVSSGLKVWLPLIRR